MNIDWERHRAREAGVQREENLPFFFPSRNGGKRGVILVHGFTASPWEVRILGEHLADRGFSALGVRLPGHGTTLEDLATRRCEEWLAELERCHALLAGDAEHIYGVGMSTGALLLLPLAAENKLHGLALLAPYLTLPWLARWAGWLRWLLPYQERAVSAEATAYYYPRRPLAGIQQLHRLLGKIRPLLGDIRTPTLVLGSAGDQTIPHGSSQALFDRLGAKTKRFHQYGPEVPHILTTPENPHLEDTLRRVSEFLANLEKAKEVSQPVA